MEKLAVPAISIGAMGRFPFSPELADLCTIQAPFEEEPTILYRQEGGHILVPRQLVGKFQTDYRTTHPLGAIDCKLGPRNADQARVFAECLQLLKQGTDHVAEAPTGWGKTWLGVALGCAMGEATLITVPKSDLFTSWHEMLAKCGIGLDQIGHIQGDKCDYKGKRFVLASVKSICKPGRYEDDLYKAFGLILFDETHRMAADSFMETCALFYARLRLGLSATPKRPDGKTFVLNMHIGPLLVQGKDVPMVPKVLIKKTEWKVPRVPRKQPNGEYKMVPLPHQPGRMMPVYVAMSKDNFRNRRIAKFVEQAYHQNRNILVIAQTRDHLEALFKAITERDICGSQIGYYVGGMSPTALKQNSKRRIVLATKGMVGEGTNCPWWDAGCAAVPFANIEQIIGRIMRYEDGKPQPVWVDFVDDDEISRSFAAKRLAFYYKIKADIVRMDKAAA